MTTHRASNPRHGFTLMELMVAMAITTIIVTVLVSITSIAIDTWNRSRSELRASRQAKALVETMGRDFESLVIRAGNQSEWLMAESTLTTDLGPSGLRSSNAADLIFYSAAMDRYHGNPAGRDGEMNTNDDPAGGDISCIGYRLGYKDPIGGEGDSDFKTFVLNRILVDPDDTFEDLLGTPDLETAFGKYSNRLDDPENFVCENVFQFTVTFLVEVVQGEGESTKVLTVPVTVGQNGAGPVTDSFRILGTGIVTSAYGTGVSAEELRSGRIKAVEISLTVLSDAGIDQMRRRPFTGNQAAAFLAKNSYQYSKRIQLPGM